MKDLEVEVSNLRMTLSLMALSISYLLAWAEQAELSGAVPEGVMGRAKKVVEMGRIQDELELLNEALSDLNKENAPKLQLKLHERVEALHNDLHLLIEELEADAS